ncbi:MAG: hypothetical protein Q9192_006419 [Flavoplaca navasiana]
MSHLQCKSTPRRANFWPFFAFATGALFFYYSKNQPLLCEAPVSSDNDLEGEVSGSYKFLFSYPTFKYLNPWFSDHGISIPGDPGKGLLRYDDFSMIAREPRQEHTMGASASDWDANGDRVPNSLAWASWGVVDGHRGPYTADVVKELLCDYIVAELSLQAGIDPHSPYRDSRFVFQDRSLQNILQAIGDAFTRLDNDLLKKAARAITGSRPLQASMQDIAPAESGCSAVLATYDTTSEYLFVANVGNCRAVLGHRNAQGTWEASQLSVDHTCQNKDEVAKLRAEHPGEADMINDGQLLGNRVTRAFGDLRWKLSAKIQSIAHTRLFGHPLLPSFLSPPYVNSKPSISITKINPSENDFVILASDGLWERMTNEQAVRLVSLWLTTNDPSKAPERDRATGSLDLELEDTNDNAQGAGKLLFRERLQQGLLVLKPEDLPAPGREYKELVKRGEENNWLVKDDNAATHLARNALGGADEDMFCALVGASVVYPMSRLRDDISIQVIFFGYGDSKNSNLKITNNDPNLSDTLDLV